jgi:hypothetical protein
MDGYWSQFLDISDSSSDDDNLIEILLMEEDELERSLQQRPIRRGGSRRGRAPNKDRRRNLYTGLLFEDYWGANPVYDEKHFRRTFRMPRELFDQILERVTAHDQYFVQKRDACQVNVIAMHAFIKY